ncbi:MAG TPA: hypothetical protein VEP90_12070, partial [Methylomirabilota bacterium]|nr:hypothetical protein [Methylomirabilota bacterium]
YNSSSRIYYCTSKMYLWLKAGGKLGIVNKYLPLVAVVIMLVLVCWAAIQETKPVVSTKTVATNSK